MGDATRAEGARFVGCLLHRIQHVCRSALPAANVSLRDMTTSPTRPERTTPMSVSYARALLFLQATCWALMCLVAIFWALTAKSAPPGGIPLWHHPVWAFATASVAATLAGAKIWLGVRISHRSRKIRQTVMIAEYMMVGFAVVLCLLTFNLDGGTLPFLAGIVGGIMSFIAAIELNEPPATQYFAEPRGQVTPTIPETRHDGGQPPLFTIPTSS
jgi:hypothetical protein